MQKRPHVELTSSAFAGAAGKENLQSCIAAATECGFNFGIQLHNTIGSSTFAELLATTLPLSAHAPLFPEHNPNFSSRNSQAGFEVMDANAALFRRTNIKKSVFHGFGMHDATLPGIRTGADYALVWRQIFRDDLSIGGGAVQNRDFTKEAEYLERRELLKNNLAKIRERYSGIEFCLENDLPVYGCGSMRATDLLYLEHPLCLDTGHLWGSSLLFGFDFYAEAERILASGRVHMVHLHNSMIDNTTPKTQICDGHRKLAEGKIDMKRTVALLKRYRADFLVLEIPSGDAADLRLLGTLWDSAAEAD